MTTESVVYVDSNEDKSKPGSSTDKSKVNSRGHSSQDIKGLGEQEQRLLGETEAKANTQAPSIKDKQDPKTSSPSEKGMDSKDSNYINSFIDPYQPIAMFVKQKGSFVCWQVFVCINQISLTWMGFIALNQEQDFLACTPSGHVWRFLNGFGDFFISNHIVMVFLQAAQAMYVFYRIPNNSGYFDPIKNPDHNMDEQVEVEYERG